MYTQLGTEDLNVAGLHVRFIDPEEEDGMKRFKVGTIAGRKVEDGVNRVVIQHENMDSLLTRTLSVHPEEVFIYVPAAWEDG